MNPAEGGAPPILGIVIPTLNEGEHLPSLLADLEGLPIPHQVVVADGGSRDDTPGKARAAGVRVLPAPRGRARQMNAGARETDAPWLFFLHADIRLPKATRDALAAWPATATPRDFGTFAFRLQGHHWFWRFIEFGQRIRERVGGLAYGDQGLLVHQDLFQEAGGFPDLPLLEDVELLRRLRRGGRWHRLSAPLLTSPRRYQEEGRWRTWLRNSGIIALYLMGVPPRWLARLHPARRWRLSPDTGALGGAKRDPILLVFAKNPEAGKVKTRLAAEVGDDEAAQIYRRLGRQVVDQVRGGAYRTLLIHDPPDAGDPVARWLGEEGLELRPQAAGTLGDRLRHAFQEALRETDRVVVVGTDAPGVDRRLVEEAFSRLESADLVLGPAADGGYYLLGMSRPAPDLFRDVPWSTPDVLDVTRARARELGLVEALLPTLADVDTLADWEKAQRLSSGSKP